ncbi:MAG: 2-hydroxyacyl-CoA dehydratase [Deltaproteobacteria bacterium]|nr:2-hydroxyacyl-CoA dehydratase [Deltaproteobacteria bacterium]
MNLPKVIVDAASRPYAVAAESRKKGRAPIAVLPGYFPAELVAAAGAHPFRVWGGRAATVNADAALQAYICSMAKSVLEDVLDGTLDFAAGFLVPSVCDTMQNLSDVIAASGRKVFCFRFPRSSFPDEAGVWLRDEVARFSRWMKSATGREPSGEALAYETDRYSAVKTAVLELYALRRECPQAFTGRGFYDAVFAAQTMDPGAFADAMSGCAANFKCGDAAGAGRRVMVSGTAPIPPEFLDVFAEHGLWLADDDFMAGRRLFSRPILESLGPKDLAQAFLGGVPCPSNTFGHDKRPGYLADLAKEAGAAGVVFWQTKACENEAFDLPWIDAALRGNGLKTLLVETEQKMRTFETAAARIAAFAESL